MGTRALCQLLRGAPAAALTLAATVFASGVEGQIFPLQPTAETTLELQWERPFFPDLEGLAAWSSNIEADVIVPLASGHAIQVGIPLAIAGADAVDGTSVYLGNLRASLLFGEVGVTRGFVGVTVPTATNVAGPDLAVIVGVLPWLDEPEKWSDDAISVRGAWIPSRELEGGGTLGLRLGASAVTSHELENLFVYARVAAWGRVQVEATELRADVATSYHVNDDDGFGRQFTAYLNLGATLSGAARTPGVFLRIPLDGDARDLLDASVGLRLQF